MMVRVRSHVRRRPGARAARKPGFEFGAALAAEVDRQERGASLADEIARFDERARRAVDERAREAAATEARRLRRRRLDSAARALDPSGATAVRLEMWSVDATDHAIDKLAARLSAVDDPTELRAAIDAAEHEGGAR